MIIPCRTKLLSHRTRTQSPSLENLKTAALPMGTSSFYTHHILYRWIFQLPTSCGSDGLGLIISRNGSTSSIQELDGSIVSETTTWKCPKQFDFQVRIQDEVSFDEENFDPPIITADSEPPADEYND